MLTRTMKEIFVLSLCKFEHLLSIISLILNLNGFICKSGFVIHLEELLSKSM